jgi:hypothetical protein
MNGIMKRLEEKYSKFFLYYVPPLPHGKGRDKKLRAITEFVKLLKEKYKDLFLYYGPPPPFVDRPYRKYVALMVDDPDKTISDLKKIARKRKIHYPEVAFTDMNPEDTRYLIYWELK